MCAPIVTLLSSLALCLGSAAPSFSPCGSGRGREGARRLLANSFAWMLIVSVVLTAVFLLTKDALLNWFGASGVTFPMRILI